MAVPRQDALFAPADETLTVGDVSGRLQRAVTLALPGEVWVRGEIHNLSRPTSGHVYFDLVGEGCAIRVVLWQSDKPAVNRTLTAAGGGVRMTDGTEVRIRVAARWFAPRGTVTLQMSAIDPGFTLGRLAEDRDRLLAALRADGSLACQPRLEVALVPLRVALVTSLDSAAHHDARHTFEASGYGFRLVEIDTRVQGPEAEAAIVAALRAAEASGVDVVCLVRGGGARTDLAAFDREAVARAIAGLGVPVLTGVGHETDTTVADAVAHARHKTPTACAEWVVARVRSFVEARDATLARCLDAAGRAADASAGRLTRRAHRIDAAASRQLRVAAGRVEADAGRLEGAGRRGLRAAETGLEGVVHRLGRRPAASLAGAERVLTLHRARLGVLDPARALARGWTITRTADGALVGDPGALADGALLVTTTAAGDLRSTVTRKVPTHGRT